MKMALVIFWFGLLTLNGYFLIGSKPENLWLTVIAALLCAINLITSSYALGAESNERN